MNIYLDIDQVLITKDLKPAKNVYEFLKYVTDNHECYWLTTHCKGEESNTLEYLKQFLDKNFFIYLNKIKPTNWDMLKTEAIDFKKEFKWFDDYVLEAEKRILLKNECFDKLVLVDLKSNPNQLKDFI